MNRTKTRKVLLIVNDTIGDKMAGPGIRFWEFARVLSQHVSVTLAVPPAVPLPSAPPPPDFEVDIAICPTKADLRAQVERAEVIVTLGDMLARYPFLAKTDKPLVLDLYDPFLLAGLHKFVDRPLPDRLALNEHYRRAHQFQLEAADFMICASEKQRDYWLGMLAILGRINPLTSDDDPTLRHLIDVVPFGLPADPPQHTRPVLKGVYPSIAPHDKVILWGGGIWSWFDAPTMIKAMSVISQHRPEVKLFFMGVNRPNVAIPTMSAVEEAMALSRELDLYNRHVFFNDWVPYADRQNYLLEADLGVSLHRDHAEARFAFRTRFLDYLWAGLPILATEGDILSEAVQKWGLGQVVKAGDVAGVAKAVLEMLDTPDLREACQPRFKQVAAQYRWQEATRPLVEFCLNPCQAPDQAYLKDSSYLTRQFMHWGDLAGKAWNVVKQQGVRNLPHKIAEYLKWKFQGWAK